MTNEQTTIVDELKGTYRSKSILTYYSLTQSLLILYTLIYSYAKFKFMVIETIQLKFWIQFSDEFNFLLSSKICFGTFG